MKMNKIECLNFLSLAENLYEGLSKHPLSPSELTQYTNVLVQLCKITHTVYLDDSSLNELLGYAERLLSNQKDVHLVRHKRNKLLMYLKKVVHRVINDIEFHLYLYNCDEVPMNLKNMKSVTTLSELPSSYIGNNQDIFVLVYDDTKGEIDMNLADITFSVTSILESKDKFTKTLRDVDYFTYIKLYLETKLNSLQERQDIQLLLTGSSYTMCGLFEKQMPIPARNVAVDSQDIYYTIKTIHKALEYNPNIKQVVFSFAYYLWGTDISLSHSDEHQPRIREINYPIFKDKHNFPREIDEVTNALLMPVTPLKEYLLAFESWEKEKSIFVDNLFKDSHYFLKPREGSMALRFDEKTNLHFAKQMTSKHEKTLRYEKTIQENISLFSKFLEEMNEKGINILVYVPPMNEYYRRCVNTDLISDFYKWMNPLKEKYNFKLLDLYDDNRFEHADFIDYDHLNDQGAKKLGDMMINELNF